MTIYNLGSINRDLIYDVTHLPKPGETLAAKALTQTLGGKGLNQSVAANRAGADVVHIGAVGEDDASIFNSLQGLGIATNCIQRTDRPTGHAIINVDAEGENSIVLLQGANVAIDEDHVERALHNVGPNDILLLQNETNLQQFAACLAGNRGAQVVYSAAPFDSHSVRSILDQISLLVMNEVEAAQLQKELGMSISQLPLKSVLITKGAAGSEWIDNNSGHTHSSPPFPTDPIDTTGAGDTFLGYLAAAFASGETHQEAMRYASAAASLMVARRGTAEVIPTRLEVLQLLQPPTNGA